VGDTQNRVGSVSRLRGLRPFPPGQSGNPGGRPRGFATYIRARTEDGQTLVDYVLGVFADQTQDAKLRLEAATWLADRGFGKPIQTTELTGKDGAPLGPGWDLARLSDQELEDAERLARAATAADAG
jgi:hypothetical protein